MLAFMITIKLILKIIAGFSAGYIISSVLESWFHQHVSDAPKKTVKKWQKRPRLFKYLIRTNYSHHVVHHRKTFKENFITQFRSHEEREVLDVELDQKGKHGDIIKRSQYAIKLHGSGSLVFVAPLIPIIILTPFLFGTAVTISAIFALSLPPLFSNFIHPYLHMPHSQALQKAPKWLAFFLKRRYFKAIARNHFMHHKYVSSNFNLVLGGDYLRGAYRKPSERDINEMRSLGVPLD